GGAKLYSSGALPYFEEKRQNGAIAYSCGAQLYSVGAKHVEYSIKVISGVRRCGKSTLLEMFRDSLLSRGAENGQTLFINFDDYDNRELLEPDNLHVFIKSHLCKGKMTYLFLDEIQNVKEFQRVVSSLFLDEMTDIFITGSNAFLLSGELATLLSGRYVEIRMLPLSLSEFIAVNEFEGVPLAQSYRRYIETSSFPYASAFGDNKVEVHDYLMGVYSTIVLKDIITRFKIADSKMLESIIRFLFSIIGSPFSGKKIADYLTSAGRKADPKTIEKYISALQESQIIYEARRFDVKGKQQLKLQEKYYVVDIGMRAMLLGQKSFDVGHILENVIYLELLRRGYEVFVGKVEETEIDFVAQNNFGNTYIQVTATVRDENTLARELRPLQAISDSYPKLILTLDDDPDADYEGIRRINALDWIMQE
ncbi:MAG: ATP-binding protein, partial [Sphaerochaetaceae bacterium]|nr:ATP-binding protein [Sphaerochaetaceae bacterium]